MLARQGCLKALPVVAGLMALAPCLAYRDRVDDEGDGRLSEIYSSDAGGSRQHVAVEGQINMSFQRDAWTFDGSVDITSAMDGMAPLRSACPPLEESQGSGAAPVGLLDHSDAVFRQNCKQRRNVFLCGMPHLEQAEMAQFGGNDNDVLNSAVLNGDKAFFDTFVKQVEVEGRETLWIIEFYADWCPHCKRFAAQWLRFGVALKKAESKVQPVSVNCHLHRELCQEYMEQLAYPKMLVSYRGKDDDLAEELLQFENIKQKDSNLREGIYHVEGLLDTRKEGFDKLLPRLVESLPEKWVSKDAKQGTREAMIQQEIPCPEARKIEEYPENYAIGWASEPTTEQRIVEAAHMMIYTLKAWVKPSSRAEKDYTAFFKEVEEDGESDVTRLTKWVDLLRRNFPRGQAGANDLYERLNVELNALHGKLNARLEDPAATDLCVTEWQGWLETLEEILVVPQMAAPICPTETCKLWTLFHVLSFGPGFGVNALTAEETVIRIMAFVRDWFTCAHCRDHAIKQWEAKAYGKEQLIRDPKGMPIWLWRLHNAVSVRVSAETGCDRIDRRWPPIDVCPQCWRDAAARVKWNVLSESAELFTTTNYEQSAQALVPKVPDEEEVFAYLARAFWDERIGRG